MSAEAWSEPEKERPDHRNVEASARKVIASFYAWMDADGCFPDPEYDNLLAAVNALAATLNMDAVTEHNNP